MSTLTKAVTGAAGDAAGAAAAKAAREAAEEAAQKAAAKAATGAAGDAAAKAAKESAEKAAAKAAKEAAEEAAQKAAKEAAEKSAKEAAEKAGKDYSKYIGAAGVAAAGGLYLYGSAADATDESNNTPRDITKIEKKEGFVYTIYFTPAIKILQTDAITISGSKTTPLIDGPQTVASVLGNDKITIDFGKELTANTPGGAIQVTTSISAQAGDSVNTAATTLGNAAGGGLGGILGGAFSGLGNALGIDPTKLKWACLIICLIAVAIGLFMVFK